MTTSGETPFPNTPRIDAFDKVRGHALFAADYVHPDMLHAVLVVSTIGRGRILMLDTTSAVRIKGVRLVLTHENVGTLKSGGCIFAGGASFQSVQPMVSTDIAYRGQPIALVVADTLEGAIEAGALVRATYDAQLASATMDAPGAEAIAQIDTPLGRFLHDILVGDADHEFAASVVKVDATYTSPPQHQNPMELISTVAQWEGERLIIREGTQSPGGLRIGIATQLGIDPSLVQVVSPYIGGAFGQKNTLQMQTVFAAIASKRLNRPVKLVVSRSQIFQDASFRPGTRHHIRIGADRSGKMIAAIHEAEAQTSRADLMPGRYTELSSRLHGIEHFRGVERLIRLDTQTPGFMRAPWEHTSSFAMESAVDELAYALNLDPVALRLANDTSIDPVTKLPLSSRHVAECLQIGMERFGWNQRSMAPQSMRAGDGSYIGWGVAIGAYPGNMNPALARLRVTDAGAVVISIGVQEMGQGVRTVLAAVVARKLGVSPQSVTAIVGDTAFTPQPLTAGSWGTATAVPAAEEACDALLEALTQLGQGPLGMRTPAQVLQAAGRPMIEVQIQRKAPGQPDDVYQRLNAGIASPAGPNFPGYVTFSYIAHFVEVRVEPTTRRVRVPRVVSIADCGRVISPRTAESQVRGGVVWGIGGALREASEVDGRYGGFLNADLAEYIVPVNADIGAIDVGFIDKPDTQFNATGAKGLGEVAMVGVAAAVANAVYHATGKRIRDLPIRIEHLL